MRAIIYVFFLVICPTFIHSYQNSSVCTGNNFFDSTLMNCEACPANQTANITSCYCNPNYRTVDSLQIGFHGTCEACAAVN